MGRAHYIIWPNPPPPIVVFIICERAKRARHSQVCSIEIRDIYIIGERARHLGLFNRESRYTCVYKTYCTSKSGIWRVISGGYRKTKKIITAAIPTTHEIYPEYHSCPCYNIYLYHSYYGNSHVINVIISLLNFLGVMISSLRYFFLYFQETSSRSATLKRLK